MNAIRIHQTGDAGVLRLETIDAPTPRPGQALVRVEADGVNFIEI
jgi:NADPH2:quinone reductase